MNNVPDKSMRTKSPLVFFIENQKILVAMIVII